MIIWIVALRSNRIKSLTFLTVAALFVSDGFSFLGSVCVARLKFLFSSYNVHNHHHLPGTVNFQMKELNHTENLYIL